MRKRTALLWAALAALTLGTLTFVACGGDGPGAPSPVNDNPAPVASTPQNPAPTPAAPAPPGQSYVATSGVCNGKMVYTTADGFMGYCTLDSNVATEGCVNVDPEKTDRIFIKIGIVSKGPGYTRTGYFHEESNQCGPTESNPGADPDNNAKSFKDGDILELWRPIPPDACGHDQWDGDIRDGDPAHRLDVLGFMIVYPASCRTCDAANLQLTKTQTTEGNNDKVTISASWNRNGGDKASLYEGSTLIQSIDRPGSFSTLTLARDGKTHTYRVVLENGNLKPRGLCEQTITVTTGENDDCEDVAVKLNFCPEATSVAPSVSKCFAGSWVNPGTGSLAYGDSASDSVSNPFTKSHSYPQTDSEQSFTATLTVVRGQLTCQKTLPFKIPPRRKECSDYQAPTITGDISSDVQPTQVVFDAGSVGPSGGSFSPTLPKTVARPNAGQPAGSFSTTYTLPYGPAELECSVSKPFTKPVPPKDDSCDNYTKPTFGGALQLTGQTPTQVTVTSGNVSPAGGTFNPTLPSVQNRPPAGSGDATFSTDYTVPYGPAELKCTAEHEYTIKIPQQEEKKECKLVLHKTTDDTAVKPGDYIKWELELTNEGDANCTGGGVKIDDDVPSNIEYYNSSGTVGQCVWQGPVHWNCGVVAPGTTITVSWKGKVLNPAENCQDFKIKNKASAWSAEKGTVYSEETVSNVDVECGPTCPPPSTTMSVNWNILREATYGNNPKCGDFGLTSLSKKEFSGEVLDWSTDRAASIVIVKDGKCTEGGDYYAKKASPTDPTKWIGAGLGVSFTCEGKAKGLSHVEMCGCPAGPSAASGAFDPYLVSDPTFE